MKVALVHDYLNQYGGGERVLEVLMEMFPEAPIYTILHDSQRTLDRFSERVARTSFLDFSLARKRHRLFIPLMPLAAQSLNLKNKYDLIISDTAGFAKGIKYDSVQTKHISYIHTPLRYAWETNDYFSNPFLKTFAAPIFRYLCRWDYKMGQRPDTLIANSDFIAGKIKKYYNREAKVIYPPVDTEKFYRDGSNPNNYYLAVGRLLHYKRFDLIVDVFAALGLPLKIVGSGPEEENLKAKIAKYGVENIELVPFIDTEGGLRKLYNQAKAVIFPQVEDFGLVAAEAQACGAPILAYGVGGALEIVKNGTTGVLFDKQTPEALIGAIHSFEKLDFDREKISQSAKRFSKAQFKQNMMDVVDSFAFP